MQQLPEALRPLEQYPQFIVYKLVPSLARAGKTDKLPIDAKTGLMPPKGSGASSIWTDATTALTAAAAFGDGFGVGFSFAESDPFYFLDVDSCLLDGGQWSPIATQLLTVFAGAAAEVSQSGRGLHIIGTGTPPPHGCKNAVLGLELYHADRFVALTGTNAVGSAAFDSSALLPWLVDSYFPVTTDLDLDAAWTTEPCEEWNGPDDDIALLERALKSKPSAAAVFGNRASFADLWYADADALAKAYPDSDRDFDHSSADMALAQHLAFWTGKNCERMLEMMNASGLKRDKWEREKYIADTIVKCASRQKDVLQDTKVVALDLDSEAASRVTIVEGASFLRLENQLALFQNCVYVTDVHKVLVPGGKLLSSEQFRVRYGGYTFVMDHANERTSRSAWEVFTESQCFRAPKADTYCFRPDRGPNEVIFEGGESAANTWAPIDTPKLEGDVTPFLTHLEKLLPLESDRNILVAYMAAVIQHKGIKFQWAPLIQGVEGNGKTLLTRCLAFAIGSKYVHLPKASQLANNFNGWMYGKIFAGVEDVYVSESQQEVMEELKPMITGEFQEIEPKRQDQVTRRVCTNFMLNCNKKGALRKTANDRRFAHFYTKQQSKADLARDGMTGAYFFTLYKWLRADGFAIVNNYLSTYDIPHDLNPANGWLAPETSSTSEALEHGLGRVEQEIMEAIDRGDVGFKGGWVSSMAVDRLLDKIGASRAIPPNKRKELLEGLGYEWHPALPNGRVNNPLVVDGGKPRLYVKVTNAELLGIVSIPAVIQAYIAAQDS